MTLTDEEHWADAIESIITIEKRLGIELQGTLLSRTLCSDEKLKEARLRIIHGLNNNVSKESDLYKPILEDNIELEPNVILGQHNVRVLRGYTGGQRRDAVLKIRKTLENMSNAADDGAFVTQTLIGAIIAVGVKFLIQLGKGLFIGLPLNVALKAAVSTIGLNFAVATVLLAVVALILYFAFLTDRNMLGLIINDTDVDWVCPQWRLNIEDHHDGNLYMAHGKMSNFPDDSKDGDLDSRQIQIKKRNCFEAQPISRNTWVACALYNAEISVGLLGSEGVMVYIPDEGDGDGFAIQFSVPYSLSNRANIDYNGNKTYKSNDKITSLFDDLYDNAGVDITKSSRGRYYTSHVRGSSGSAVCGIHSISNPRDNRLAQPDELVKLLDISGQVIPIHQVCPIYDAANTGFGRKPNLGRTVLRND